MKRILALLLALCLILCGCGKKEPEETTAATTEPPVTQAPTTEATEPPTETTEPPTEATEPINLTHPLTGEQLDEPFTKRPVASTINNAAAAMPQYGLNDTDWMFEIETEGDVTRCMGVFTNPGELDTIGPVRSARTYFISLSASFGAPLAHCGGSNLARAHQHSYEGVLYDYRDIDEMYNGQYFFRDSDRLSRGYSYEHTLFTTGKGLQDAMTAKGFDDDLNPNGVDFGYQFEEEPTLKKADSAKQIEIRFRAGKKTTMTYNKETGRYEGAQHGSDWIDANTGDVYAPKNVLVIYAKQSKSLAPLSLYTLEGEGEGYLAIGGKIVPVQWSRAEVHEPFSFTFEDGTPVTFAIGNTYAAVVDPSGSVTFG